MADSSRKHFREGRAGRSALRPEARSLTWAELDGSQRAAFRSVISALAEAIEDLGAYDARPTESMKAFFESPRSEANQTLLLTGDRGTGKTSLLLSVAQCTVRPENWSEKNAFEESGSSGPVAQLRSEFARIEPDLKRLRRRLVWLAPLEMELLPGPTNLLAAILSRVEAVIDQMGGGSIHEQPTGSPGILDPRSGSDSALMDLRRLTADVSLAWDGNLPDRGSQLDPDAYAVEVMRAERVRVGIVERFRNALDRVAKKVSWGGKVDQGDCTLSHLPNRTFAR